MSVSAYGCLSARLLCSSAVLSPGHGEADPNPLRILPLRPRFLQSQETQNLRALARRVSWAPQSGGSRSACVVIIHDSRAVWDVLGSWRREKGRGRATHAGSTSLLCVLLAQRVTGSLGSGGAGRRSPREGHQVCGHRCDLRPPLTSSSLRPPALILAVWEGGLLCPP